MRANMAIEAEAATEQGQREYQEDRYVSEKISIGRSKAWIFAVMDGHSGRLAVELCAARLVPIFKELRSIGPLSQSYLAAVVKKLAAETEEFESGSTLALVCVPGPYDKAYVAVLGDSLVAIRDKKGELFLAPEHNVRSNPQELKEAQVRGGFYRAGYLRASEASRAGIQMSRSLGDGDLASFLNRTPETFEVALGPKSIILLASDGLLDPAHMGDRERAVKRWMDCLAEKKGSAKTLAHHTANVDPTYDNVTVIVARSGAL